MRRQAIAELRFLEAFVFSKDDVPGFKGQILGVESQRRRPARIA